MTTSEPFIAFPKIPRLMRDCVITEKIDGTNASIRIEEFYTDESHHYEITAASRTRWIEPNDETHKNRDNFGFAAWVEENADDLIQLGVGHHFGEWYGAGIQRGYGMTERRFALFNTARWADGGSDARPSCCDVVPVLYEGLFTTGMVDLALSLLEDHGSLASGAGDDARAEGVVVYHVAARQFFKRTIDGDEKPKGSKE